MKRKNMATPHLRKSIGRSLLLLLAFLAFPHLLAAYPQLTIPFPGQQLAPGTISTGDANGNPLNPPVSYVTPQTLFAWGGAPISGYTWTLATGSTFPPGTTVAPLTGIFQSNGSPLIAGTYSFIMTVSDGSTTANGTFSYTVEISNPPRTVPFEQSNRNIFPRRDTITT